MDAYFDQVDAYVELAESKVRECLQALAKIGLTRKDILRQDFFEGLVGRATKGKDAFEDYFNLVDYYVETATRVIEFLRNHLRSQTTLLEKDKESKKFEWSRGTAMLRKIDTTENTSQLLESVIQSSFPKYNVQSIQTYLTSKDLDHKMNEFLTRLPEMIDKVRKFVNVKKLMIDFGNMKKKFVKFRSFKIADIPLDKQKTYALALQLFHDYNHNNDLIARAKITQPDSYLTIYNTYDTAFKPVGDLLRYLQGGVSQAFLILRNTNDVNRSNPNKDKLLTQTTDRSNLIYVDRDDSNVLGTVTNNFTKVFHGKPEEQPQINESILSTANFDLLEKGGNVIIIAYGQSGTGKTYNLTRLIEYFSSLTNFNIEGISSVQFYNDVMLPNGNRITIPLIEDNEIPREAAERAVYKTGQLTGLKKMDARYDSTKMYDVVELAIKKLKLKIEPVVTRMPQLPSSANKAMQKIQLVSKLCFDAAVEVNKLATSNSQLNRLLESYKQILVDYQHANRLLALKTAYDKFCKNEFFLPMYSIDEKGDQIVVTMQECIEQNLHEDFICSKHGIQSFHLHEFKLSEADLETLTHPLKSEEVRNQTGDALSTCVEEKFMEHGIELIHQYNRFLLNRRMVYVLCDSELVTKKADIYTASTFSFQNASLIEPKPHRALKLVVTDSDDDRITVGFETALDSNLENQMYDKRSGYPYILYFTKYDTATKSWQYRQLECSAPNAKFIFKQGGDVKDTLDFNERYNKENFKVKLREHDIPSSAEKPYLVSYDDTDIFQTMRARNFGLGNKEPALLSGFSLRWTRTGVSHYTNPYSFIKFTVKPISDDLPVSKKTCPTEDYTLERWSTENHDFMYATIAKLSQTNWTTDEHAYCAKFEHHVQISKTGPDNESNYTLFDHDELRYKSYFEQTVQDKIQLAYTADYTVPIKKFSTNKAKPNLKKHYDRINLARFTRAMPQNPESSRSQLATTLHLSKNGVKSKLVFIDLAGNERVDTTKKHIVTSESVYINSTLQFVTDMFLRMKEEYPGWTVNSQGDKMTYTEVSSQKTQDEPPTQQQLVPFEPADTADPFQRYLHAITTESPVLKPAIVMVVCAYEYYSSWIPPNPSHEVSKESLRKTFGFISALFSFGKTVAEANDDDVIVPAEEVDTRGGRRHRTRARRNRKTKRRRTRFLNKR
jgi:hypothetical protein